MPDRVVIYKCYQDRGDYNEALYRKANHYLIGLIAPE